MVTIGVIEVGRGNSCPVSTCGEFVCERSDLADMMPHQRILEYSAQMLAGFYGDVPTI